MDPAKAIRDARLDAGLTQKALAERAGTSQATISAYESGAKQPSVATLSRILAAAGSRLSAERSTYTVTRPSAKELERRGRILRDVLDLAQSLPFRRAADLGYPRIAR